jgi:hypothetical protein
LAKQEKVTRRRATPGQRRQLSQLPQKTHIKPRTRSIGGEVEKEFLQSPEIDVDHITVL